MIQHYYYPDLTDEDTGAQSKQHSQHHIQHVAEPRSSERQSHNLIHHPALHSTYEKG